MVDLNYNPLKSLKILSILGVALILSCSMFSDMGGNTQSIEQLTASPFIAELNGSTTKTISLSVEKGSHIAWMGFDQSGDYNYFKVEQITIGSRTIENESGSSVEVFENISVSSTTSSSLLLTITYKAKKAMESEDDPFSASLLIVFDYPETKTIQIQLNGYVQGVCDDCVLQPDHQYVYQAVDNDGDSDGFPDFELYLCDAQAIPASELGGGTLPDDAISTVDYAFDYIQLPDNPSFVIYSASKKPGYYIIDAGDGSGIEPTIPPFEIPVPGGEPIPTVEVSLEEGSQAVCPEVDGIISCSPETESGIRLYVAGGLLNVEEAFLTNGSLVAENSECGHFGTWEGSGTVGEDNPESDVDLTLIAITSVSESQSSIVSATGINSALIVAVIRLQLITGGDL